MTNHIDTDICVIGAGSGGLSVAAGAAQMGADTVLIERGKMGGDCLNYGCVPSKALIAASRTAQAVRRGARFGVNGHEPAVDFAAVHDHVHGVIAAIAPIDSVERFEGLGVRVIQASARFTGRDTVAAGDAVIRARRFVVATGSAAAVPPIPGLDDVPYLTNETIFDNRVQPDHLIVIGGGPIGLEMAQAHRRLGSRVTVLEKFSIMPKDDAELVDLVRRSLVRDGIELREGADIARVEKSGNGIAVIVSNGGGERRLEASDVLVAAGRRINVDGRDLVKAIATPRGRILGAGIVGPHAGEVIQTWVLAMSQQLKVGAIANMIAPYPTLGEVSKRAAGSFYVPSLFSDRTRKIVRLLARFG